MGAGGGIKMRTAGRRGKSPANARVFGGGGPSVACRLSSRACRGISGWFRRRAAESEAEMFRLRRKAPALDMTEREAVIPSVSRDLGLCMEAGRRSGAEMFRLRST